MCNLDYESFSLKILPLVRKLATLFSATGGNFSAIHIDYVDFVPVLGWRFRSRNLWMSIKNNLPK